MAPSQPSRPRRELVLIVDFGTTQTKATLLVPGKADLVPVTNRNETEQSWPSCVYLGDGDVQVGRLADARRKFQPMRVAIEFKRYLGRDWAFGDDGPKRAWELARELLGAIRERARELVDDPVDRLLITCPGDYKIGSAQDTRWVELHRACEGAGFTDIEYQHEPVAASYAPVKKAAFNAGQVVLVYDFGGGTFDAAIVRIGARQHQVVAADSIPFCGGADIDTLLIEEIREVAKAGTGDDRVEARLKVEAVEVKKRLSQADPWPIEGPDDGEQRYITRTRLNELITAEGLIDKTLALVNRLVDDSKVKPDAVLPVGGTTLIPLVKERIMELRYPVSEPVNESSAVIDGAAAWARLAADRRAAPSPFVLDDVPLRWPIPGERATVSSWLAEPEDRVNVGDTIVRVRLPGGELWDLRAGQPGTLVAQHYKKDDKIRSADWLATLRPLLPNSTSTRILPRLWRAVPGPLTAAALSTDGQYAAAANATQVTVYDLLQWARRGPVTTNAVVEQLVFVPGGDLIAVRGKGLIAWDPALRSRRWTHDDLRDNPRVAPSPDGRLLAVSTLSTTASTRDREIRFISVRDRTLQRTAKMQPQSATGSDVGAYSPDGRLLVPAAPGSKGPVTWDQGSTPEIVPNSGQKVVALAIRPPDNLIFASSGNTEISVYDKEGFKPRPASTVRAETSVRSLVFNPSGTLLACGLSSGTVELRRPVDGKLSGAVGAIHTGSSCFFIAFTPDECSLVTGNKDGLAIWNLTGTTPPLA
ncbi:MAG TPA: Hsp70 family protein [Trebonia sp.]|nr:Hsp70 family protein [Trebonia sp.]